MMKKKKRKEGLQRSGPHPDKMVWRCPCHNASVIEREEEEKTVSVRVGGKKKRRRFFQFTLLARAGKGGKGGKDGGKEKRTVRVAGPTIPHKSISPSPKREGSSARHKKRPA